MGIFKHFSCSTYDNPISYKIEVTSNNLPDPNNYIIIRHEEINNFLLVEIKYLDCINYDGHKIMIYEDCKLKDLIKQKHIDPHFSNNYNFFSPIARFEPTQRGWDIAKITIYCLLKIK